MSWDIKLNENSKIIELIYSGIVTPIELKDALGAAATL
jgi:hypothetical protein